MLKDLCYSTNESLFYTYLLNENGFNTVNDSISGANVVKLFLKSKLDKFTLKKIWDLASERKAPDLNKLEFFCACRFVALAQRGEQLTNENAVNLNYKDAMPKFEGVHFDPNAKNNNNIVNNNINNSNNNANMNKNMFQYNNFGNQQNNNNLNNPNLIGMLNNFNFQQNFSNNNNKNMNNNMNFNLNNNNFSMPNNNMIN